jgi:ABC-type phosphate transport system substrate-binding protein
MWNDPTIVSDQSTYGGKMGAVAARILLNTNQKINVIVRNDNDGTSEIFSTALGLFDPRKSSQDIKSLTTKKTSTNFQFLSRLF